MCVLLEKSSINSFIPSTKSYYINFRGLIKPFLTLSAAIHAHFNFVIPRFLNPSLICSVRKSHQRALESLQASLDVEVKGRAEGLKLKKKLEAEVNELELQVDLLTKNNAELSKNSKKMQQQIKV